MTRAVAGHGDPDRRGEDGMNPRRPCQLQRRFGQLRESRPPSKAYGTIGNPGIAAPRRNGWEPRNPHHIHVRLIHGVFLAC